MSASVAAPVPDGARQQGPRRLLRAALALVSTSVLVYFGTGLHPWWPLLWFAPLPALAFALYSSRASAALIAGLGWFLGMTNLWHYFRVLQAPPAVWIGFSLISALVFTGAVLLFRGLLLRGAVWIGVLAFPAAWVVYEYVRNLATPHGTAGSIAYSQLEFLPFLQFASIAGPWGMAFVLFLVPASIAAGIYLQRCAPKQAWRVPAAALAVTAAILLYGAIRLVEPQPGARVRVGLIASDGRGKRGIAKGAAADRLIADYAREAERLSAAGARAIVIPRNSRSFPLMTGKASTRFCNPSPIGPDP